MERDYKKSEVSGVFAKDIELHTLLKAISRIFVFCILTDKPMDQVIHILDAHDMWNLHQKKHKHQVNK